MTLTEYLTEERVVTGVEPDDVEGILQQLVELAVDHGDVSRRDRVLAALLSREKVLSTGIGHGIAIPHAISAAVAEPLVIVGICPTGVDYRSMDGEPVHVFFVLLSPPDGASHHTGLLARIARLARDPAFVRELRACRTGGEALAFLSSYERTHA